MKRLIFPLILFILLIFEGIALDFIPLGFIGEDILIVPHWVLIFLVLMALFYDTNNTFVSIFYGVLFGLLIDVIYTGILGVYMFAYPVALYVTHLLKKVFLTNIFMTAIITIFSLAVAEVVIVLIYFGVGVIDVSLNDFLINRLLPTILSNIILLFVMYPLLTKRLLRWRSEQLDI